MQSKLFTMNNNDTLNKITTHQPGGRIAVPFLLWVAGVPLGIVFLLWLFIFRG